jgi:hypothetical protein
MAAPYDLALVQGETYTRTFTWKINGVVQSLADRTIKSQIRAKESISAALVLDLAQYMTKVGDEIHLRIPATVTAELSTRSFRTAAWDLFLIETADPTEAECILAGVATLDPASTRTA